MKGGTGIPALLLLLSVSCVYSRQLESPAYFSPFKRENAAARLPLYISQDDEALKALLKNTIANLVERLMIVDDDRAAAGQRRLYQAPRLPAQQEQFGNKKRDKVMWDKYMKGDNNNLAYDSMVMAQM